jgi:Ca2+-binding EF-hand superfamily protein
MSKGKIPLEAQDFFSKEALQSFQNAFNAFDEDGDERNPAELLGKLFRAVGYLPRPDEVEEMIADVPETDPFITFEDFVFFLYYHARATNPKRELFNAFRLFDWRGTGQLSVERVREILLNGFEKPLSEIKVDELLSVAEVGSDNMIDCDDFAETLLDF